MGKDREIPQEERKVLDEHRRVTRTVFRWCINNSYSDNKEWVAFGYKNQGKHSRNVLSYKKRFGCLGSLGWPLLGQYLCERREESVRSETRSIGPEDTVYCGTSAFLSSSARDIAPSMAFLDGRSDEGKVNNVRGHRTKNLKAQPESHWHENGHPRHLSLPGFKNDPFITVK